jgi:hypothetical protein
LLIALDNYNFSLAVSTDIVASSRRVGDIDTSGNAAADDRTIVRDKPFGLS